MVNWKNPYENLKGEWLRGNLHTHTSPASPCGRVAPERVLRLYTEAGYDFLSLSDHLRCTVHPESRDLILVPGMEWNSRTPDDTLHHVSWNDHVGIYSIDPDVMEAAIGLRTRDLLFSYLMKTGALVVLNHPDWLVPGQHYSEQVLFEAYEYCSGMEIWNSVIEEHEGNADSSMKWDRVLTEKGPILGFVSDDSHREDHIGKAWLMAKVKEHSPKGVLSAVLSGYFYCSTGVKILDVGRCGDEVYCFSDPDIHIDLIGENGRIFRSSTGSLRFDWKSERTRYFRFALYGHGKSRAWTQPFFR